MLPLCKIFEAEAKLIVVSVKLRVTRDFRQEHLGHLQRPLDKKTGNRYIRRLDSQV